MPNKVVGFIIQINKILIVSLLLAFAFCLTVHQEDYASTQTQKTWDELSVDVLVNNQWKFINDNGLMGIMGFSEDGKITKFNNDNEKTWVLDENGFLTIKRSDGVPTTTYTHAFRDSFGKWHLEGRFKLVNIGWRHFLVQQ